MYSLYKVTTGGRGAFPFRVVLIDGHDATGEETEVAYCATPSVALAVARAGEESTSVLRAGAPGAVGL